MAGRRVAYAQGMLWLWLLLARGASAAPLVDSLPKLSKVGDDGAGSYSSYPPERAFRDFISAVGPYVEGRKDMERADGPTVLLKWLKPSKSEASVQAFIDRLQNSLSNELGTLWEGTPDLTPQSDPSGNDTSPCDCQQTTESLVPKVAKASIRPLSPLAITAIVLTVSIILIAAVCYIGKRYLVRQWQLMQIAPHLEVTNAFERLRNMHEMEHMPDTTATTEL